MKSVIVGILLMLSTAGVAGSIEAPGEMFYKMPSGELVTRSAVLEVPSRGRGDVVLKGGSQNFVAERFFTKKRNGRSIFYVVFDNYPGRQEGEKAVYRGTYTRGSNAALYYGDVFILSEQVEEQEDLDYLLSDPGADEDSARYVAGFRFRADK